nr:hypothetical protein Iba_chr02dCG4970 [Ipomoea batatas]
MVSTSTQDAMLGVIVTAPSRVGSKEFDMAVSPLFHGHITHLERDMLATHFGHSRVTQSTALRTIDMTMSPF